MHDHLTEETGHVPQKLIEKFGSHKAVLFNIGQGKRDTGVRYEDVAGLDDIKADIEDVMRMVLGDDSFIAIGAKPPRVSAGSRSRI